MTSASLDNLPTETLGQIARHLIKAGLGFEDNGLCNLRLVCQSTYLKTQYEFGIAAFSTLRVNLQPKTLNILLRICGCPAYGEAVRKIIFSHWGDQYVSFPYVQEGEFSGLKEQVLYVLGQVLKEAFSGMPDLKEMTIVAPFIARFRRQLDVQHLDCIPGPSSLHEVLRDESFRAEEVSVSAELFFDIASQALAETHVHLTTFELTRATLPEKRKDDAVATISDRIFKDAAPRLKHMKHLVINLTVTNHETTRSLNDDDMQQLRPNIGAALNSMTNISHLELHCGRSDFRQSEYRVPSLVHLNLPHLTTLILRHGNFSADVLQPIFLAHRTTLRYMFIDSYSGTLYRDWLRMCSAMMEMTVLQEVTLKGLTVRNTLSGREEYGLQLVGREEIERELAVLLANTQVV